MMTLSRDCGGGGGGGGGGAPVSRDIDDEDVRQMFSEYK